MTSNLLTSLALIVGMGTIVYAGWRSTSSAGLELDELAAIGRVRSVLGAATTAPADDVAGLVLPLLDEPIDADEASVLRSVVECGAVSTCTVPRRLEGALRYYEAREAATFESIGAARRLNRTLLAGGTGLAVVALLIEGARLARRRRQLREQERALGDVDDLLRRRLEQIYQLKMSAAEANRFAVYGELAAGFSHRLKTPLAGVRMAAQLARRKLSADHAAADQMRDIISEVDRLLDEVNRFLSATSAGTLLRSRLSLASLVASVVDQTRTLGERSSVALVAEIEEGVPDVLVDPALLEMGLRNLVDNAVAASPAGETVRLIVRRTDAPPRAGLDESVPPFGEWAEVAVVDRGPGIDPAILRSREPTTTKEGGSGVGLAISRRVAARHGGAMLVESGPSGTTVRLVLPGLEDEP